MSNFVTKETVKNRSKLEDTFNDWCNWLIQTNHNELSKPYDLVLPLKLIKNSQKSQNI